MLTSILGDSSSMIFPPLISTPPSGPSEQDPPFYEVKYRQSIPKKFNDVQVKYFSLDLVDLLSHKKFRHFLGFLRKYPHIRFSTSWPCWL